MAGVLRLSCGENPHLWHVPHQEAVVASRGHGTRRDRTGTEVDSATEGTRDEDSVSGACGDVVDLEVRERLFGFDEPAEQPRPPMDTRAGEARDERRIHTCRRKSDSPEVDAVLESPRDVEVASAVEGELHLSRTAGRSQAQRSCALGSTSSTTPGSTSRRTLIASPRRRPRLPGSSRV